MSNFSQFFPAGSGGSGGSGINSYAPFKVTATGNPIGYNATTGVYTNPVDDSVWLKTGFTLAPDGTYPNAAISDLSYTGVNYNLASGNITQMVYSDTFIYATFFGSTSIIRQFTLAGVSTGLTYTDTSTVRMFWDGTHLNSAASVAGGWDVTLLNNSLVQQGVKIFWATVGGVNQICTDGTYVYALQSRTTTRRYDFGTFANELIMSTTGIVGNGSGIEFYNNQIVISSSNDQKLYFFSTSLGAAISSIPTTSIGAVAFLSKSPDGALWSSSYTVQTTLYEFNISIGDGTSKTDTDSAQPLFIKLK
jgi:hypothetical protein